ncbi:MAG TPA: SURF1 family protein [Jatrophihabitans sp.]|uniref:SURF1 family protein n=1 Tax=Jatrophihabitans sp. TaxID=1932789 RepID=UPI002F15F214
MLSTLRQPRYLGLFGLMLVLATVCVLAGTWQAERFQDKRETNQRLRAETRDRPVDVTAALGKAAAPISDGAAQRYRQVTATGRYLSEHETLLRKQSVGGDVGVIVLTPLKTADGVLLVARGFVRQTGAATTTPAIPPSPSGTVSITTRLEPAGSKPDKFGQLPGRQVESVNPVSQARRIGAPVWTGYAELLAGQPGAAGLTTLPGPDLSNPAGGAEEPQHAAYVVQWYLFALLALCAPFVMAAAERRRDRAGQALPVAPGSPGPEPGSRDAQPPTGRAAAKAKKASLDDRLAGRS